MEIVLNRQLMPSDYVAANWLHAGVRQGLLLGLYLLAVSLFIPLLENDPHVLRTAAIIWIIVCPATLIFVYFWWGYRAKRVFFQQKSLRIPYEIRIKEEAFLVQSEIGQARLPWSHFYKWKANKGMVLLYQSDRLFQMMPRHIFTSDEEFDDFKALLVRVMGPMNRPQKSTGG
jgi:hypothetical protein